MKLLLLGILISMSSLASATTLLDPGQVANINGETVVCGGSAPTPPAQTPFTCACFTPNGRNVGTVTVYASDKQGAVYTSTPKCRRTFNDYTLSADPLGCFPEP